MLLNKKTKKELTARHFFIFLISAGLVYLSVLSRKDFILNVRLGRALADTAFTFLTFTLAIGPLAKLWKPAARILSWRRETGIWFFLLALAHFLVVNQYLRFEVDIELPRLLGLIALFWALILAITSSDRAVIFLGPLSWKWLHSMAYVIFYLAAAHGIYFLLWRYPAATNWFQYPFLAMAFGVPILQLTVFVKEVGRQKADNINTMEIQKIKLPILEQKTIAEKTCEVSFDLSGQKFDFLAGQYIRVSVSNLLYPDPKGNSRVFSIASSPNEKNKLSIAFRDSGSGFKRTLMELPLGSLVEIEGPFGYFTLPKDSLRPLVFIAGGIGITPFLSMIRFVNENKLNYQITLLYANQNKESGAYLDELEEIARQNSRFILKNKFGYIDEEFIKQSVKNLKEQSWYIVGPPPMVAAVREILARLNIDSNKIYLEDFYGY